METKRLQQFLAIVDARTITAAAAQLRISQPSLSQSLIAFERELGVTLFTRRARNLELTAAGRALVEPSRRALRAIKDAEQAVLAVSGVTAGTLEIAAAPALLTHPLAAMIEAFLDQHPNVQIRVAEAEGSDDVSRRVLDGRAELGLLDVSRCDPSLTTIHLVSYEILLVLPPWYPAPPLDVPVELEYARTLPLVTSPPGTVTRRLIESAVPEADVRVETNSIDAILAHIVRGSGAGLLISPYARLAAEAHAHVLRLTPPLHREIGIAFRGTEPAPAARAFLALGLRLLGSSGEPGTGSRVVD